MKLTWALPVGYNWDVRKFAKQVKTKAWAKKFKSKLAPYANRFTSEGADLRAIVRGMVTSGYGVNIGEQVNALIPDEALESIKWNVIASQD